MKSFFLDIHSIEDSMVISKGIFTHRKELLSIDHHTWKLISMNGIAWDGEKGRMRNTYYSVSSISSSSSSLELVNGSSSTLKSLLFSMEGTDLSSLNHEGEHPSEIEKLHYSLFHSSFSFLCKTAKTDMNIRTKMFPSEMCPPLRWPMNPFMIPPLRTLPLTHPFPSFNEKLLVCLYTQEVEGKRDTK